LGILVVIQIQHQLLYGLLRFCLRASVVGAARVAFLRVTYSSSVQVHIMRAELKNELINLLRLYSSHTRVVSFVFIYARA